MVAIPLEAAADYPVGTVGNVSRGEPQAPVPTMPSALVAPLLSPPFLAGGKAAFISIAS